MYINGTIGVIIVTHITRPSKRTNKPSEIIEKMVTCHKLDNDGYDTKVSPGKSRWNDGPVKVVSRSSGNCPIPMNHIDARPSQLTKCTYTGGFFFVFFVFFPFLKTMIHEEGNIQSIGLPINACHTSYIVTLHESVKFLLESTWFHAQSFRGWIHTIHGQPTWGVHIFYAYHVCRMIISVGVYIQNTYSHDILQRNNIYAFLCKYSPIGIIGPCLPLNINIVWRSKDYMGPYILSQAFSEYLQSTQPPTPPSSWRSCSSMCPPKLNLSSLVVIDMCSQKKKLARTMCIVSVVKTWRIYAFIW